MVHGCMVYTRSAETAAISCGSSHASAVSTPLRCIFKKTRYKKLVTHVVPHVSPGSPAAVSAALWFPVNVKETGNVRVQKAGNDATFNYEQHLPITVGSRSTKTARESLYTFNDEQHLPITVGSRSTKTARESPYTFNDEQHLPITVGSRSKKTARKRLYTFNNEQHPLIIVGSRPTKTDRKSLYTFNKQHPPVTVGSRSTKTTRESLRTFNNEQHPPITVGSRSTKTARGTRFPDPDSLKKVRWDSGLAELLGPLSWSACLPSLSMPCSRQYSSQQALPI